MSRNDHVLRRGLLDSASPPLPALRSRPQPCVQGSNSSSEDGLTLAPMDADDIDFLFGAAPDRLTAKSRVFGRPQANTMLNNTLIKRVHIL